MEHPSFFRWEFTRCFAESLALSPSINAQPECRVKSNCPLVRLSAARCHTTASSSPALRVDQPDGMRVMGRCRSS